MQGYQRIAGFILALLIMFTGLELALVKSGGETNAYAAENVPLALKYDDFSATAGTLQFNGTSTLTYEETPFGPNPDSTVVRLTSDYSQGGSIFAKRLLHLADDLSFSTYFKFMITSELGDMAAPGEGFTFTLQTAGSDALVNHGPSMGTLGSAPSVSVEFDTRVQDDPSEGTLQHSAVFVNGNYDTPSAVADLPYQINNLQVFEPNYVWIEYNGTGKTLEMRISNVDSRPPDPTLTAVNLDLGAVFTTAGGDAIRDIYAGFTANTSVDAKEAHYIMQWYFKNDPIPIDTYNEAYIDASSVSLVPEPAAGEALSTINAAVYEKGFLTPVAGLPVEFSTSFGSLDSASVITDVYGTATAVLSSDTSGIAVVRAVAQGGALNTTTVELYNPAGDTSADYSWLTGDRLLKDNTNLDNVTGDLNLPLEGPNGSAISWESSAPGIVDIAGSPGMVTRPDYTAGDRTVTLTAAISKGDVSVTKVFSVVVKAASQTDEESLARDMDWLTVSRTLGDNVSQYAVVSSLSLPPTAPNGSMVTWESSVSEVISSSGDVVRPAQGEAHRSVTLTAVLTKGGLQDTREFPYTVLAETDTVPPETVSATPENNSTDVIYSTRQITVNFSEAIEKGAAWDGIKTGYLEMVRAGSNSLVQQFTEVDSLTRIDGDKLILTLTGDMKSLIYYRLFIPANAVQDASGNNMPDDFTLNFKVEQVPTGTLYAAGSTPADRELNVSAGITEISINYSDSLEGLSQGTAFEDILLLYTSSGAEVPISRGLTGNTVILTLGPGAGLEPGQAYEVRLPAGAVQDRFKRKSSSDTIQFKTRGEEIPPEITGIYPADNADGINIYQSVDIRFSEQVKADCSLIALFDDKGAGVPARVFVQRDRQGITIDPVKALLPAAQYTLAVPGNSVWDLSDNPLAAFEVNFTTGSELLEMDIVNISPMEYDVSLDTPVEIGFSAPVTRGTGFADIEISDSGGNLITFLATEAGDKAVLVPEEKLEPAETYTVKISRGAYKDLSSNTNDALEIRFVTAPALEIRDTGFIANPAAYYAVDTPVTFSTEGIEGSFKRSDRAITAFEWTFSDGSKQGEKKVEYSFTETGNQTVVLNVTDNKGVTYEYTASLPIVEAGPVAVSISPERHTHVIKSDDREENIITYSIRVPREAVPVTGSMKVSLYKVWAERFGGSRYLLKTFNNITIPETGILDYDINYDDLGDAGGIYTYEVVFQYDEWGETKTIRRSFRIDNYYSANLRIALYDASAGAYINSTPQITVKVDGENKSFDREWLINPTLSGYCLRGGLSAETHEVEVSFPNYYTSEKQYISLSDGPGDFTVIKLEPRKDADKPKLRYIKSQYTDSSKPDIAIFVHAMPYNINLSFTAAGDWNGFEPGYLELQTTSGKKITSVDMKGTSAGLTVKYFLWYLDPGDGIKARMVSKDGTNSPWVDAKLLAVENPEGVYTTFTGSGYWANEGLLVDELLSEKIPVLTGIPLLENTNNFGLFARWLDVSGSRGLYDDTYVFSGGTDINLKSAGFITGGSFAGAVGYTYNPDSNTWEAAQGEVKIIVSGEREWRKDYAIPGIDKVPGLNKLDIGGYAKLIMQADVGGTFIIVFEPDGEEYKGILYFAPDVEVVVGAGNDAVNVEGYGGGKIAAQVHIPTGYVQVDPSARAGIRVKFLLWEGNIYSVEAKTSWNNGKEKVPVYLGYAVSEPVMEAIGAGDLKLTPMSRDYLDRPSEWVAGDRNESQVTVRAADAVSLLSFAEQGIVKSNIYPDAEVQLVQNGDELWLIWTDDNPERSDMNRTQVMYSVEKDGSRSEPQWLGEDGTADFSPVSAAAGNGVLMAWQDVKEVMPEDAEMDTFIRNMEISVSGDVCTEGNSVQTVTLTDDAMYDHSPTLAADGDKALLVWTKSDPDGAENSDSLVFSGWDGSIWSEPEEIAGSLPEVMNSSLAMHGDEGLLLYTLNMAEAGAAEQDRTVYARVYDGNSWGDAVQISTGGSSVDGGEESAAANPRAVYVNGVWFITWYQNGSIMYKEGMDGAAQTAELLSHVQPDYKITLNEGENPQIALVYQRTGAGSIQNLAASFYDIEKGIWSGEAPLTEGDGFIRSFTPLFTEDGKLKAAYTQAEVITEVINGIEYQKPGDKVDFGLLAYTPVHDLALEEQGPDEEVIKLSPENPVPGTVETVTVTVRNSGDFAENAVVYLYDGDPEQGGTKIGEAVSSEPVPARSSAQLEAEWFVDLAERDKYHIYVVADPDDAVSESDETNNIASREIIAADIEVTGIEYEKLARDDYLVTAKVINTGGRSLEGIEAYLHHEQAAEPLQTGSLEELKPGQEADVSFALSLAGLVTDENGRINMSVTALPVDGTEESDTDNNTYKFTLKPAPITVDSMDPGAGETGVEIQKPLTFSFNMEVAAGEQFSGIILEDDNMNTVAVEKTLDGNTLTVKPQSSMQYNTRYTLTIPDRALANSYGHTMDSPYQLSFETTKSSPEAVFAYPGDGMENTPEDTDIKIKFNQNVSEEVNFSGIALYGPGSEKLAASVSLEGEWLYIDPAGRLEANKVYTVLVPAGAVKNERGEILQDDYALEFYTGQRIDRSSGSHDNDSFDYRITRQTAADGSSTATVKVDAQSVLRLGNAGETVTIDVTAEVKNDETIKISLDAEAVQQLAALGKDLQIVTGKGDVRLPRALIEAIAKKGETSGEKSEETPEETPMVITIAMREESENDSSMVSGIMDISITAGNNPVREFKDEVTVTIPLDMAAVGNPKRVIACAYDEESGSWQPMGGVTDSADGTLIFKTRHFSTFAAFENIIRFSDVTSDWAKEEVEILASRRLINGKTETAFAPEDSITRAEFTAIMVRSLYTEISGSRGTFRDIPEDAWFSGAVETASGLGLIKGIGEAEFEPNARISREQMAAIAYRLYCYKAGRESADSDGAKPAGSDDAEPVDSSDTTFEGSIAGTYKDSRDIASWAEEAVEFAAGAGIMKGSEGRFYPERSATRQEATVVLYRLLEHMGEF